MKPRVVRSWVNTFDADVNRVDIAREYSYMRRVTAMVSAAAVVLLTASVFAQGAAASFNGKWTREMPAAAAGGGGGAAGGGGGARGAGGGGGRGGGGAAGFQCGMTCTLTVTAAALKIDRVGQDGAALPALNFKLDGTDSSNPGRAGQDGTPGPAVISKAKWDGAKIVITTSRDVQGTAVTTTQTLSIDGGKLTVSSTNSAQADAPAQVQTYTKG